MSFNIFYPALSRVTGKKWRGDPDKPGRFKTAVKRWWHRGINWGQYPLPEPDLTPKYKYRYEDPNDIAYYFSLEYNFEDGVTESDEYVKPDREPGEGERVRRFVSTDLTLDRDTIFSDVKIGAAIPAKPEVLQPINWDDVPLSKDRVGGPGRTYTFPNGRKATETGEFLLPTSAVYTPQLPKLNSAEKLASELITLTDIKPKPELAAKLKAIEKNDVEPRRVGFEVKDKYGKVAIKPLPKSRKKKGA